MWIRRISLRHFRNIPSEAFEPSPHLNFLVGNNGQGKTSWLEAIGLAASLRSFRGAEASELLSWGEKASVVDCDVVHEGLDWKVGLSVRLEQTSEGKTQRTALINVKPYRSAASYLNQRFGDVELGFHVISFSPSDHRLVYGEPSGRRTYLNQVISAEKPRHLDSLRRYQKILDQRNAVLRVEGAPQRDLLRGFTDQLAPLAAQINYDRLEWLCRIASSVQKTVEEIAPFQRKISLFFASNWMGSTDRFQRVFAGQEGPPSLQEIEQLFLAKLDSLSHKEWAVGTTLVGPHRDDWGFVIGEHDLQGHGSQGEIRTSLLALKLSEIELFRQATSQRPVLLLDDFSSELDRERRKFLLSRILRSDLQVFVTTTEASPEYGGQVFQVERGMVSSSGIVREC